MTQRKGGTPAEIQNTEETTMKTLKIYNPLIAQIASESNCFTAPAEEYAAELLEALENDDTDLAEYAATTTTAQPTTRSCTRSQ